MNRHSYKEFYRRHLPHIAPPDATLFVTYRLAGSIPQAVVREYQARKEWIENELQRLAEASGNDRTTELAEQIERWREFKRAWFGKFEDLLHTAQTGPRWMQEETVAKIVADSLRYLDGKSYRLEAYCVMPNHVHTVFRPLFSGSELKEARHQSGTPSYETERPVLSTIMQSLKGYTAREANRALGRQGQFWEHESYDHYIRDAAEFDRVVNYVLNNPVKAGLVKDRLEWKWSFQR